MFISKNLIFEPKLINQLSEDHFFGPHLDFNIKI